MTAADRDSGARQRPIDAPSKAPSTILPPLLAKRYRVERELGAGGLGRVAAAFDRLTRESVAIKTGLLRSSQPLVRREFAALRAIEHPGVLRTLALHVEARQAWLVTERIDGPTLAAFLAQGPDESTIRAVWSDLLSTLQWLHARGLVHGDVKPTNVLVPTRAGAPRPVLIDFGLARGMASDDSRVAPQGGTPGFAAPEQLGGGPSTPASDLWALGACFRPWLAADSAAWAPVFAALCAVDPGERSAAVALRALQVPQAGAESALASDACEPPEAHPPAPLATWEHHLHVWSDALRATREALDGGASTVRLHVAHGADADSLAAALQAELPAGELTRAFAEPPTRAREFSDCWTLGTGRRDGVMAGLAAALGLDDRWALRATAGMDMPPLHAVQDVHRSHVETLAHELAVAWRSTQPGLVLVACAPESWDELDEAVLAALSARSDVPALVIATASAGGSPRGYGGEPQWVSDPKLICRGTLDAARIEEPSPGIRQRLERVAAGGTAALLADLNELAARGWLQAHDGTTAWRWSTRADALPPLRAEIWSALYARLTAAERAQLDQLALLGGEWTPVLSDAMTQAPGPMHSAVWALAADGWVRVEGPSVRATSGAWDWLTTHGRDDWSTDERTRATDALLDGLPARSLRVQRHVGRHLAALNRRLEAAQVWERMAQRHEQRAELGDAAVACLQVSRLLAESAADRAFGFADRAARFAEVAGRDATRQAALEQVEALAASSPVPLLRAAAHVVRARDALFRGQFDEALRWAHGAMQTGCLPRADRADHADRASAKNKPASAPEASQWALEACLVRGLAGAHAQPPEVAGAWLEDASVWASHLEDAHAVGRVANALGTLHYQAGRWAEAARCYLDSATVKAQTSDRRGERIAQINAAMALRGAHRWAEATAAVDRSLTLAEELNDARGLATASLLRAVLAADRGELAAALAHLNSQHVAGSPSRVTALDALVVRARLALGRGEWQTAADCAREARVGAGVIEAASIAGEAACLEVAAMAALWRESLASPPPELAAVVDRLAHDEGAHAHHGALRLAQAWLEVVGGEWTRAAERLRAEAVQPWPRWIGVESALGLGVLAAEAMGDDEARAKWWQAAGAVAWQRLETTESRANVADLARALGLGILGELAELPQSTSPGSGAAPAQGADAPPSWPDCEQWDAWARVLAELDGAEQVALAWWRDGRVELLGQFGTAPGQSMRWAAAWTALRAGQSALRAQSQQGQLVAEAVGRTPPVATPGSEEPAANQTLGGVAQWRDKSTHGARPNAHSMWQTAMRLVTADMERAAWRRAAEALAAHLAGLEETSAKREVEHREALSQLQEALSRRNLSDLHLDYSGLVVHSDRMKQVLRTLDRVASSDLPVLLLGESGVGKELLAQSLHRSSGRHDGPLVVENCGAIPAELFESTFFGHTKGAFTGAGSSRDGLFVAADGGTLFLDEVGELRPDHQVKLLRTLQDGVVRPVGGNRERRVDVRVVAATNQDLERLVASGHFREDLYYRLAVVAVHVPALRERPEDVLPLAQFFLEQMTERTGRKLHLSAPAAELLVSYGWPGNVRELQNAIWRASVLTDSSEVQPRHLPPDVRRPDGGCASGTASAWIWDGSTALVTEVEALEKRLIEDALRRNSGKKAPTARMLGLSRPGLDAKIARYGVQWPV